MRLDELLALALVVAVGGPYVAFPVAFAVSAWMRMRRRQRRMSTA